MVHSLAGELMGGKLATRAAVPRAAPLGQHGGAGGRRLQAAARRGVAGAPRRAVPRRAARVPAQRARRAAPAAGDGRDGDRARQPPHRLPLAHPAGRRHEPMQVRRRRAGPDLQAGPALRRRLSGAHLRAAARPHRSADRGAGACPPPTSCCRRRPRAAPRCARRVAPRASVQRARFAALGAKGVRTNAECSGALLEEIAMPDEAGVALLRQASEALQLSARGFHRTLRVARTLADLDGAEKVAPHARRRSAELPRRDAASSAHGPRS